MNIWKRYSMRVSKNWVKFNKMFTLSPWNHEVRCVLLELIERGVIFGSSDLVYSVATDSMLVEVERIYAIHALQALNDPRLGEIAALMVSQHPDWPDEIVREAILALIPSYLSVAQLCQSLGWLQWKKR